MKQKKTFSGKYKPYGRGGWFYESQRHSLAAQGVKTGSKVKTFDFEDVGPMMNRFKREEDKATAELKQKLLSDEEAVEAYEKDGKVVQIFQDVNAESPDTWGNDDVFLVHYHSDFWVDRKDIITEDDARKWYNGEKIDAEKDYYIIPIEAYIHSGVSLAVSHEGNFPDRRWDVSHVGLALAKKSDFNTKEKARKAVDSLVETWNQYLGGDVYGYKVTDPRTGKSDSVWGFYGLDSVKEEANAVAKAKDMLYSRGNKKKTSTEAKIENILYSNEPDQTDKEILTIEIPKSKEKHLAFLDAYTKFPTTGIWKRIKDRNIQYEIEFKDSKSEKYGKELMRLLNKLNKEKINEQVLYARTEPVEESTLG